MMKQAKLKIVKRLKWIYNIQCTYVKWVGIAIYYLEAFPDRMTFTNKVFHKHNDNSIDWTDTAISVFVQELLTIAFSIHEILFVNSNIESNKNNCKRALQIPKCCTTKPVLEHERHSHMWTW